MGLYDRLKADNKRILGDDMQEITLENSAGEEMTGTARVTAVGMDINMQGQAFATKKYSVCFNLDIFSDIIQENETFKGWKATFTNSYYEEIIGRLNNPLIDKTLNHVVATLTTYKSGI